MKNLYNFENNEALSKERLRNYWRHLGENHFKDYQLKLFNNGFFQVMDSSYQTLNVYDSLSCDFINRLQIAELPYLTFHAFENGYMAVPDKQGGLDVYAPNGRFFTRLNRQVKWWGALSVYVYLDDDYYYLADITDANKKIPLGKVSDILFVEQNINGLISIRKYFNKKYDGNYAELYNADMEKITPVPNADKIIFFANGSFIIRANDIYYMYNAQMELLLNAGFGMEVSDDNFCLMRGKLYSTIDGSIISADNKPIYTSIGKLFIRDEKLITEDGTQILGYCPVRPQVFNGYWLHMRFNGRDLIFDPTLSLVENRQVILSALFERDEEEDISKELFEYICLIEICCSGRYDIRRKMLKSVISD